jgi:hypothetical protein
MVREEEEREEESGRNENDDEKEEGQENAGFCGEAGQKKKCKHVTASDENSGTRKAETHSH